MRVTLKVTKGTSAGKVFEVKVPQFVIGRSSGCQLRPQSDAISRQHCAILISEDKATVRDLGSRNGTMVNGETILGERQLATGDEVRVGPLYLEVTLLDRKGRIIPKNHPHPATRPVSEKRRVDAKQPVANKVSSGKLGSDSGIISDWLLEEEGAKKTSTGLTNVETRQFNLDETERIELKKASEEVADLEEAKKKKKKDKKKEPGKLPQRPEDASGSSREAAEKTLRKMFNRGL